MVWPKLHGGHRNGRCETGASSRVLFVTSVAPTASLPGLHGRGEPRWAQSRSQRATQGLASYITRCSLCSTVGTSWGTETVVVAQAGRAWQVLRGCDRHTAQQAWQSKPQPIAGQCRQSHILSTGLREEFQPHIIRSKYGQAVFFFFFSFFLVFNNSRGSEHPEPEAADT